MDRAEGGAGLKISSFQSVVGTTWVLSTGFCVLGYFKTKKEAEVALKAEDERRAARADPRQMSLIKPDPEASA
jgi:hypothetical protein